MGTGIRFVRHITTQARSAIEKADRVLHLVDHATGEWIAKLNPSSESLRSLFQEGKDRARTDSEIVDRILSCVREEQAVCAAFYGHPGFFWYPSHEAIRRARAEGFAAEMLPGISAQDCLFADLGLDPGRSGCQSFDAEDFVTRKRIFDTSTPLILFQADLVDSARVRDVLREQYEEGHQVILYEAAISPEGDPRVEIPPLKSLNHCKEYSTILVLPARAPDQDLEMYERLGLKPR